MRWRYIPLGDLRHAGRRTSGGGTGLGAGNGGGAGLRARNGGGDRSESSNDDLEVKHDEVGWLVLKKEEVNV